MDKRLLEQIDACRHSAPTAAPLDAAADDAVRADAALPELAEAMARGDARALRMLAQVEAADAAISAALHDVPVPDDLADRLLVALKAVEQGEPVDETALRSGYVGAAVLQAATEGAADAVRNHAVRNHAVRNHAVQPAAQAQAAASILRRTWLGWAAAGAAVAAAAALFCLLYPWAPQWVTSDEIAEGVNVMYDSEIALVDPDAWTAGAPVSEPPVFSEILLPQPQRWRELKVGRYSAVAYDLTGPGAPKQATLLVIDRRVRGLDHRPPTVPFQTHGRCVGVWQSESQVFALIVKGDVGDYQQFREPQAIA